MKRMYCDVFLEDYTTFEGDICITGNLYAGNDVTVLGKIDAIGSVIFEDRAEVSEYIESKEDIVLGDYAHAHMLKAGDDIVLGDNTDVTDIEAGRNVVLGDNVFTWDIDAKRDITVGYNVDLFDIKTKGSITLKDDSKTGFIKAKEIKHS